MNQLHQQVVRICSVKNSSALSVTNIEEGKVYPSTHIPRFHGNLVRFETSMFDAFFGRSSCNFNYSLVFEEDAGAKDQETGEFTGCYGSIYRNESDVALILLDDPIYDYDRVNPYQVMIEHPLTIIQAYNASDTFFTVDIFKEALHSFPVDSLRDETP